MELQYLKYFSSVADTLNFSEAAKRCGVSQPSLSAQIRILEDQLGTQLFHRNKRTVSLTREGKALVPRVKKILMELDGLSTAAKELQDPLSGALFVGATPLIPHTGIFDKLSSLSKRNPALRFSFSEGGANDLIEGLLSGQLDLIFLPYREKLKTPLIQYQIVAKMEVALCYPKGPVSGLPFINIRRGCGLGEYLTDAAKQLGEETSEGLQATGIEMIKRWIQLGMGWSILPAALIRKEDERILSVRWDHSVKPISLCAAMLRGQRAETLLPYFRSESPKT